MVRDLVAAATRALTGVAIRCLDPSVLDGPRVYFANHSSHLDFLVIWASLPQRQRERTVPVAARDYWQRGRFRRWLSGNVFQALLVDRTRVSAHHNPIDQMDAVLASGRSLIIFPEGTRSVDGTMKPFRSGLYHLARRHADIDLVPVCLENLNRLLPKGEILPVPLVCAATFGRPVRLAAAEPRDAFLERAHKAVEELRSHAT